MKRLDLFPISTRIENDRLTVAGHDLASLADRYGTPLYVYDSATLDFLAQTYAGALSSFYPGASSVTYAGKAFLCKAIAQWTQRHGFTVDCAGAGEIGIAVAAGVKREKILVHGVNKSDADLKAAAQHAGTIVIDNPSELRRNSALSTPRRTSLQVLNPDSPNFWLRLLPGVSVATHHKHTQTGHHDSKFGMTREELLEAAALCKEKNLPLRGIHFHQGSNFRDPEPLIPAIESALDLAKEIGFDDEWHFCPGGGWGVAYHEDELPHPPIESYVRGIAEAVVEGCKIRGLNLPRLHLEPGRSLIARAGIAIYRVGTIKKRGDKTWILTDGGMADNPRYALYGARYSCLTVSSPGGERSGKVSIAGPYCESGDILIEDLPMPEIKEGDLIAIPVSGAYHLSMASNYNGARKPAALWLEKGGGQVIQRRERAEDLLDRDAASPLLDHL
ncbi:MAG: diaminopimelate decarboxylase [Chloroflexi bacterium]|nr:diaminopimelate decarboxylase [Anaerolineales bacterium]MCQ3953968.1 diaminopimelate decarboxylase [Chloroflexota bacterium]RIK55162.1 MAG: diaminopimelate decarboxylase [Chloroflexota bacterium]